MSFGSAVMPLRMCRRVVRLTTFQQISQFVCSKRMQTAAYNHVSSTGRVVLVLILPYSDNRGEALKDGFVTAEYVHAMCCLASATNCGGIGKCTMDWMATNCNGLTF